MGLPWIPREAGKAAPCPFLIKNTAEKLSKKICAIYTDLSTFVVA